MALLQAERIKELEEATRLADQMDLLVAEVAAQGGRTAEVEAETDVVPWLPLPPPPQTPLPCYTPMPCCIPPPCYIPLPCYTLLPCYTSLTR